MIVVDRVAAVGWQRLDQMHENAGPLDVTQEFVARPTRMRPFDKPRQVGHNERAVEAQID